MRTTQYLSLRRTAGALAALAVSAILATAFMPASAKKSSWDEAARINKADYHFLEARRLSAIHAPSADYYTTSRRAVELNPGDIDAEAELGYCEVAVGADAESVLRGIDRLRRHYEAKPEDYFWSTTYAGLLRRMQNLKEVVNVERTLDSIFPDRTELSLTYCEDLSALAATGDTAAFTTALGILNRLEKGVGKAPWLVTRKVRLYSGVRDTVSIMREVGQMLAESPKSSERNLLAASIFNFFARPDSALIYFDRACELDPENADAILSRADFYRQQGDSTAYENELYSAMQLSTLMPQAKEELLTGYLREHMADTSAARRARVENLFGAVLSRHPHESGLHNLYGAYLAITERYAEAAEEYRYATDLDPNDEDLWRRSISATAQTENWPALEKEAKRAATFFPDNYWWYQLQAVALSSQDDNEGAYAVIDSALATHNFDSAGKAVLIGWKASMRQNENPTDTIMLALYDEAVQLDPSNYLNLNNYAYALARSGKDLDKAERLSRKTIDIDPENPTYLDTYAWVLFRLLRYQDAKEYIDKALAAIADPEIAEAYGSSQPEMLEHAGDIYYMCGAPEEALEFWKKALALDPDNELLARKVKAKAYLYK